MRMNVLRCLSAVLCLSATIVNAQAPVIDASQPVQSRGKSAASASGASSSGAATGDLYMQLQSLQQEVMDLRGLVEEQRHQIETLKQQSLDRYNDLDRRLSGQGGAPIAGAASTPSEPSANTPIDANTTPVPNAPVAAPAHTAPASSMETAKPEEYEAYQTAYAKLKGQDFNGAIKLFTAFSTSYPNSSLAPNAYYWLGKAYLLVQPQDLNKAQQAFTKVGDYPQNNKAADALYELGKVYFLKGDKAKSKTLLQQVIDNYGASGSSAPKLAKQFLDQNFAAAKRG